MGKKVAGSLGEWSTLSLSATAVGAPKGWAFLEVVAAGRLGYWDGAVLGLTSPLLQAGVLLEGWLLRGAGGK